MQTFTPSYWIGLNTTAGKWPNFRWLSGSVPPPSYYSYEHWGRGDSYNEPNNLAGNEYCVVANSSEMSSNAWGWSDWNCSALMPYLCRLDGEPRLHWQQSCR
jgi:hypothetical protein